MGLNLSDVNLTRKNGTVQMAQVITPVDCHLFHHLIFIYVKKYKSAGTELTTYGHNYHQLT